MFYHLFFFYIILILFNPREKSSTHHLEEPHMSWQQFISFHSVTYHASLTLYWKKMIFYVFRTISVCMAILLIELNLKSLVLEYSRWNLRVYYPISLRVYYPISLRVYYTISLRVYYTISLRVYYTISLRVYEMKYTQMKYGHSLS